MKVINNYVLVKPKLDTDKIKLSDGSDFYVDNTFEEEKHAPTEGVVVEVPDSLRFTMKLRERSVDFDVDMELSVGDRVYFHYLTKHNCEHEGRVIEQDGETLYLIDYDQIYVAVRGEEVIPINGYLLVEPIIGDKVKSDTIEIPDLLKAQESHKFAKVIHVGTPVRRYRRYPGESDCDALKKGDIVAYSANSNIPVQYAYFNSIEGKKEYKRMQRRDVFAIIPEEILDKVEFN